MARGKRKVPDINSSSTADIAFLLLIFFLITTSMDTDQGLARLLPPPPDEENKESKKMSKQSKKEMLIKIENEMKEAAKALDFEKAMELRDILFELKEKK